MNTKEFSSEFDVLINAYSSNSNLNVNLDEYEKSVCLTLAQEEIVRGLYNGNLSNNSLEETEELRRGLEGLIKTDQPTKLEDNINQSLSKDSTLYKLKDDVWFITYESAELSKGAYCENNSLVQVIPMKQDEWHRSKNNPFKMPNRRKVIRLDYGNNIVELVSAYPIQNYKIRYISKPSPIILDNLEDLTIDGEHLKTECILDSSLHRLILEGAVQIAIKRASSSTSK